MNFEEPLKLPFLTAHSSGFLHHPPPFKERNKIGSIHCSRKRRIRQKYANSKSISLIAFVPPCEPPSCWRQSQSRPRSGRPGGSHPSTLRHDKSQGQPMDNREQKLQCREWQEGARTCSFGHRVLQEHHLHIRRPGLSCRRQQEEAQHRRRTAEPCPGRCHSARREQDPPFSPGRARNGAGMEWKWWRQRSKHRLAARGLRELSPRPGAA